MAPERPDLFLFLDHRAYLKAWFEWKKAENPKFSHRSFARMSGQGSPSLLLQVIKGERNLTETTARGFCKAIRLDAEESAFFLLLLDLDRAKSAQERNAVWERIAGNRRFQQARQVAGDSVRYLSHWYFPAIRELALCPGFQADPDWIARHLRPPITAAQAARALQTLQELDLLRVGEGGAVEVTDTTVVTPHEVAGLAVRNYHRSMLERAADAIDGFRGVERHMGAVTVAIPVAMVPVLKREVAAFQERILELCDSQNAGTPEQIYQLNLQLFPLSAPLKESAS